MAYIVGYIRIKNQQVHVNQIKWNKRLTCGTSTSSHTINGSFPPSSSVTGISVSEAVFIIYFNNFVTCEIYTSSNNQNFALKTC